jgi:hypothetical protein
MVRSHTLLRSRHPERGTSSRGLSPQSKSPASLLLLAPCHAHSKLENTYIFGRRAPEAPTAGVEVQMPEPKG